jgi:serine/threonine-protein kinase
MWQKSGSSSSLGNRGAKEYIKRLNRKRFAGHSDWRMPTVEELASLLAKSSKSGVHINSVFDHKRTICWTVDKYDKIFSAWIVDFKRGQILTAGWSEGKTAYANWYSKNYINYVKAVRSIK